jgi:hypothetical protein
VPLGRRNDDGRLRVCLSLLRAGGDPARQLIENIGESLAIDDTAEQMPSWSTEANPRLK